MHPELYRVYDLHEYRHSSFLLIYNVVLANRWVLPTTLYDVKTEETTAVRS